MTSGGQFNSKRYYYYYYDFTAPSEVTVETGQTKIWNGAEGLVVI